MSIKKKIAGIVRGGLTLISPKLNNAVCYRIKFGRRMDLEHPVTLNDKVLWLKFHTYKDNPVVKQCADKLRVRDYLTEHGFGEYLNDLLDVYYDVDEIDWDRLPDRFALKLNVGCACNLIVSDRKQLDVRDAERTMRKWMRSNYWMGWAELQYKGVKRCILAEKYLGSDSGELPEDYKFFCFNGKVRYVMVCLDREIGKKAVFYYFDRNWTKMPFSRGYLNNPDRVIPKPENIDEAFDVAERMAAGFPFVRVDLYIVGGKIIFGEYTFTPSAGLDKSRMPQTDRILGELLELPMP